MRPEDFQTETWKRFSEHVRARIDELRELNDVSISEQYTAQTRGGISELKKLLDLAPAASSSNGIYPGELAGVDPFNGQS